MTHAKISFMVYIFIHGPRLGPWRSDMRIGLARIWVSQKISRISIYMLPSKKWSRTMTAVLIMCGPHSINQTSMLVLRNAHASVFFKVEIVGVPISFKAHLVKYGNLYLGTVQAKSDFINQTVQTWAWLALNPTILAADLSHLTATNWLNSCWKE